VGVAFFAYITRAERAFFRPRSRGRKKRFR